MKFFYTVYTVNIDGINKGHQEGLKCPVLPPQIFQKDLLQTEKKKRL